MAASGKAALAQASLELGPFIDGKSHSGSEHSRLKVARLVLVMYIGTI